MQKVIHAEAFNEVCEALNKVHNAQWTDWDLHVLVVLWDYRGTCKKLTEQMPPRLEYGANAVIPIEYKMPNLRIVVLVDTMTRGTLEEGVVQLNGVECLEPKEEI